MTAPYKAPRRTQRERREAAVAALLDATIVTVAERGLAATSTHAVATRAGLTSGGLFRHFATREDLLVAAASEVGVRQLTRCHSLLKSSAGQDLDTVLDLVRGLTESPENTFFYEILVAARTDDRLRARLAPVSECFEQVMRDVASSLPAIRDVDPTLRDAVLFLLLRYLDGHAVLRPVESDQVFADQAFELLRRLIHQTVEGATVAADQGRAEA